MYNSEYKKLAEVEENYWWFRARRKVINETIKKYIPRNLLKSLNVLDFGCGTGGNHSLLSKFGKVIGVDISEEALMIHKNKYPDSEIYNLASIQRPSFNRSFNLVLMADILEHVDDDSGLLKFIKQYVASEGYLLITVPAYQFLWSEHDEALQHKRRYSYSQLAKQLHGAGFKINYASHFFASIFPLIVLYRFINKILNLLKPRKTLPTTSYAGNSLFFNTILTLLFSVESFLMKFFSLPFGASIIILAQLADINCPICNSPEIVAKKHKKYSNLRQCLNCQLAFIHPKPTQTEIKKLYNQDYFNNPQSHRCGYENYQKDKELIIKTSYLRLNQIEKYKPDKGKLLDVGCAMGFFLEAAQERGWDIYGIDVSPAATSVVKKQLDGRVFTGTLEEIPFPRHNLDVITMWDVIEHVSDPKKLLQQARILLKNDGVLVLTTPNSRSLWAKLMKDKWIGYKDEHFFYFNRKNLKLLLEQTGFSIKAVKAAGKFIQLQMFIKRISLYSPLLASLMQKISKWISFSNFNFYAKPFDIMMIIAEVKK